MFGIDTCSWLQTSTTGRQKCNWDGPRLPHLDKDCDAIIDAGDSGYCICRGGEIGMKKNCKAAKHRTCNDACAGTLSYQV